MFIKNKRDISYKTLIILFLIYSNCYAMGEGNGKKSYGFVTSIKKCLRCFMYAYSKIDKEDILFEVDTNNIIAMAQSEIERVPLEVLYKVMYELPPPDILFLSISSKNLKIKITNWFWKDYLKVHQKEIWDNSLPCIKIAFAYSLLEQRKIKKAAELGHPKAVKILEKEQERQQNNYEYYKRNNIYYRHKQHLYPLERRKRYFSVRNNHDYFNY